MARILIVEDDAIIALDLAEQLGEAGFSVIGPATGIKQALDLLARDGCDVAVLDVNLGTETSEPLARRLAEQGIPFVSVSGYASGEHPSVFKGAPLVVKPVRIENLIGEIRRMLDGKRHPR